MGSLFDRLKVIEGNICENVVEMKVVSRSVSENSKSADQSIQKLTQNVRTSDEQIHALVHENKSEIAKLRDKLNKLEASSADINCLVRAKFDETNQIMSNLNEQLIITKELMKSFNEKLNAYQTR